MSHPQPTPLGVLAATKQFILFQERLSSLPLPDAINELLELGCTGLNSMHFLCLNNAPLHLLRAVDAVMEKDVEGRNLYQARSSHDILPLHYCISNTMSIVALVLVIEKYPEALLKTTTSGKSPIDIASGRFLKPGGRDGEKLTINIAVFQRVKDYSEIVKNRLIYNINGPL